MTAQLRRQREYFNSGITRSLAFRRQQLDALLSGIRRHERNLLDALQKDLGKSAAEAYTSEIGFVLRDARHAFNKLPQWMKSRRVRLPFMARPGKAHVVAEPLGVVLIIGPWNYPFQLLFSPLLSALAAGNCAVVKPSEYAPHTAEAVNTLCRDSLPEELVAVVQGGSEVAADLVARDFNHIFFTGSTNVGRRVAAAAAAKLTPVTLELGGKSPCLVCEDAPVNITARRILWGKCLNAGQTCVAPDYALVHESRQQELLAALNETARQFTSGDGYSRIVNRHHFDRLTQLMAAGGVCTGGETDDRTLTIKPAFITGIDWDAPIMQQEIFGPILPVMTYRDFEAAIAAINNRPPPLAAYLFTSNQSAMRMFRQNVRAGSICINDTLTQIMPAELPFGGVGESGQGRYHGKYGFDTFSNLKSVMVRKYRPDFMMRYPPYNLSLDRIKAAYGWLMK